MGSAMPRKSASHALEAAEPATAPVDKSVAGRPAMAKVLVIDDDHLVRRTISRILQTGDYQGALAEDGAKGVAKFRSERPDLVITDIIMPEQEGIETIIQLLRD